MLLPEKSDKKLKYAENGNCIIMCVEQDKDKADESTEVKTEA